MIDSKESNSPVSLDMVFLVRLRTFLVERWEERRVERGDAPGKTADTGMCRFTAYFLSQLLPQLGYGTWYFTGGDPYVIFPVPAKEEAGYRDIQGEWHAHYWITDGANIIDLACEQFGGPLIYWGKEDNDRYQENYSSEELREHIESIEERVESWLDMWDDIY